MVLDRKLGFYFIFRSLFNKPLIKITSIHDHGINALDNFPLT